MFEKYLAGIEKLSKEAIEWVVNCFPSKEEETNYFSIAVLRNLKEKEKLESFVKEALAKSEFLKDVKIEIFKELSNLLQRNPEDRLTRLDYDKPTIWLVPLLL